MHTLIAFATQWGSKQGGINSFNTDFLTAFGVAYYHSVQVICIVASATDAEIEEARNAYVRLVPLPYPPQDKVFAEAHAQAGIDELKRLTITFDTDKTVWLGHDRFTGAPANAAAKVTGGRSALIHHMSYDHYESYAERSSAAYEKKQKQTSLFQHADLVLAIGPLLRDAASDLLGEAKPVHMLIPGMAEIAPRSAPKTFSAFLSGRLSDDAARIKQGHLGIAAFAQAHREARDNGMPDGLCKQPKLVLRGVDFEVQHSLLQPQADPETELKQFAEEYAQGVINLHALPYTHDRETLYADLSGASVALMPSWHEGFGLVAWEAIAAGVPLIISENSGVYRLLEQHHPGAGPGCVWPINVCGSVSLPYFRDEDLKTVVGALKAIANNPGEARRKASELRGLLGNKYTWPACAEEAAKAFEWHLQKGSIPAAVTEQVMAALSSPVTVVESPVPPPASPLLLPQKQWKAGCGIADSQLLRAEEAVVPFDPARQPEIDTLNAWLDDPQWPHAVRLVTGAGGLGKTRLALELCQQRIAAGWHAGFLDTDLGAMDMLECWQTLRTFNKPLLIVIDYAETRQEALLSLIKALLQNPDSKPVRLLLLARAGGEWWDNLPSKDPHCEPLLCGYATTGPFSLPPLHTAEQDRRQAYQHALHAFSQAFGVPAPNVVPELTGEHFDRPLYLQMAALLAIHGERPTTAEGLTRALLNHERRYWRGLLAHFSWAEPERHAQQLLALATLSGGFATHKEAYSYWGKANGTILSVADFNALFHDLSPLYPGKQGLQAVRPDLLGEALVAQALLRAEAADLLDTVLSNTANRPVRRHALTVIARLSSQRMDLHETLIEALVRNFAHCSQEIIAVCTETTSCLPSLAEKAFSCLSPAIKSQVAGLLGSIIYEESVQLAELNCLVTHFLMEKARQKLSKKNSVDNVEAFAIALSSHSINLSRTGRNEEALSCDFEVVKHFELLCRNNRQRFEPHYAASLNNYAVGLRDVGQGEEALRKAQQALAIRERLAQKNPDRYDPDYATSLSNCAISLSDSGQDEEALQHAQQALAIRERLAQKNPDWYDFDYTMSLNNYANHLSNAGQDEEALKYAGQALAIRERLAQKNPDRYDPDYAMSLNNYANRLSNAGQGEEALQALAIYERLAQKNPDRYDPEYAMSLNNYANHLSEAGQGEEALQHARQALTIRKCLAQKNPDRYDPDYATSLSNCAISLSDSGQDEEALKHAQQALALYEHLAHKNPRRFDEDLFSSICSSYFLRWLCNNDGEGDDLTTLDVVPVTIPSHRRLLLELYSAFIRGSLTAEQAVRCEAFKLVLSKWDNLSFTNRTLAQPYLLCAAAWCAEFAPEAVGHLDWQAIWRQFTTQRHGRIPEWMKEVARRMGFQWPA